MKSLRILVTGMIGIAMLSAHSLVTASPGVARVTKIVEVEKNNFNFISLNLTMSEFEIGGVHAAQAIAHENVTGEHFMVAADFGTTATSVIVAKCTGANRVQIVSPLPPKFNPDRYLKDSAEASKNIMEAILKQPGAPPIENKDEIFRPSPLLDAIRNFHYDQKLAKALMRSCR